MTTEPPTGLAVRLRANATLLDRLVAGYILVFCAALVFIGRSDPEWGQILIINVTVLVAIVGIVLYWNTRSRGLSCLLRQTYPAFLYPLFYNQMQTAIHWIIPEFLDHQLVGFERALFGVDLNVWLQSFQHPLINEWMMTGYFAYYFLIPIVVVPLHIRGRREEVRQLLTATTIAFLISYLGFVAYPVEGPRYFLASELTRELSGWFFVPLVKSIIAGAAIHGGCMPSSHTAVAMVLWVWARRTQPRLAKWLAPFVFTLFVATVWGRFHYLADMLVGAAVGLGAIFLADRIYGRTKARVAEMHTPKSVQRELPLTAN